VLARAVFVVDEAAGDTGLALSFGVDSEAIEALSASVFGDDLAVGDVFDLEDGHAGACLEDAVRLASDTVEAAVVSVAVGDRRHTSSIHEVEILGADFASRACFLDAAFDFDVLADSGGRVRLEASGALGTFALGVEGEAAVLGVLGGVVAESAGEFVV